MRSFWSSIAELHQRSMVLTLFIHLLLVISC
uniref:Uncharacterized protein n=1 Tax=Rhizophora mucronata TaxID=61149 RepID=A0A2P2Q6L5_RHIMU